MTISKSSSAPLFAVVGATGQQGRSVIDALVASKTPYRVRGLMRDTGKAGDLPSLGVEPVAADAEDQSSLEHAFKGAKFVFAMTAPDFSAWPSTEKEERNGKKLVDAAQAAGVEVFIYSALLPLDELSKGKHPVMHFDGKANVAKYARSLQGSMRIKTVLPGNYSSNYWTMLVPRKQDDGTFVMALPMSPQTQLPTVDMGSDFGRYVEAAAKDGSPDQILAGGHYITVEETAAVFSQFSGKKVVYQQVPAEPYHQGLAAFVGEGPASAFTTMWEAIDAVGYYAGEDLESSNRLLQVAPRTLLQSLEANREAVMKVFA